MAGRTFLFVATSSEAWGEAVLARRIAGELAAGDSSIMLAPRALEAAVGEGGFDRVGYIDRGLFHLIDVIPEIASAEAAAAVVMVDAATVMMHLSQLGQDGLLANALERAEIPLLALDVWNLPATDLTWDFGGGHQFRHSRHAIQAPRARLCPVPFLSPDADGAYRAIGEASPASPADRDRARTALGLSRGDRLILFPTARWQLPKFQHLDDNRRIADRLPALLSHLLGRLDLPVAIAHVGPERLAGLAELGARYRYFPPMPPVRFADLLAAADLLLSVNTAATTITTAIVSDLPVLLVTNGRGGANGDEILAGLEVSAAVRDWVAATAPMWPFRVWPMGLASFLEPLLANNPFADAVPAVELLDERRFVEVATALLVDERARAEAVDRQRRYADMVRGLPSARELIDRFLEQVY